VLELSLACQDIDRNRATPLDAPTVDRLAREFHTYGSQYPLFSESRSISETSIVQFLDTMAAISRVKDPPLHSDLAGTFQSVVGLWQILVRQQGISEGQADSVLSGIVGGFAAVKGDRDLFDAGRNSVKLLLNAKGNKVRLTEKETSILRYLYRAGQRPVSRETLLRLSDTGLTVRDVEFLQILRFRHCSVDPLLHGGQGHDPVPIGRADGVQADGIGEEARADRRIHRIRHARRP